MKRVKANTIDKLLGHELICDSENTLKGTTPVPGLMSQNDSENTTRAEPRDRWNIYPWGILHHQKI